jgi:sulfoxide reductase heme-binding subunit YedZ
MIIFYLRWKQHDVIQFITDVSGYISLFLLAISLILGPMNVILKQKNPVSTYIRRDIGIFGGSLALLHSGTGLFVHLRGKPWLYFLKESGNSLSIRLDKFGIANYTGIFAALIIILLLSISNDYFLKKLKAAKWKNLQRFAYFMFIFVLAHSVLYRVSANNNHLIYYLYIPIFFIILIIQFYGLRLTIRNRLN